MSVLTDPGVIDDAATTGHEPHGTSAWALVILGALACLVVALASGTHIGLVLIVLPIVIALTWQSPRMMLTVLPVWMVMLGLLRRLTPGGGNITFSGDPVLIIGPIIILLLFLTAVEPRGLRAPDPRSRRSSSAFCILALVEVAQPVAAAC